MIGSTRFCRTIALCFACAAAAFLPACDFVKEKKTEIEKKYVYSPEELKIREAAKKYFPSDESLQNAWISKQLEAYEALSNFIPDISTETYSKIRDRADAKFPTDYAERLRYMVTQSDAYLRSDMLCKTFAPSDCRYVQSQALERYPDDFAARVDYVEKWRAAFLEIARKLSYFPKDESPEIRRMAIDACGGDSQAAMDYIDTQYAAFRDFETFAYRAARSVRDRAEQIKDEVRKGTPVDYVVRRDAVAAFPLGNSSKAGELSSEKFAADSKSRAEEIFSKSVFTKRGVENEIYAAVLVKMRGKSVVLCTKEFIPEKFPVVFSNSRGKIVCSRAYVSDELPVVLLLPDSEPKNFTPLEIADADDCANLINRKLFMIAPRGGGYGTFGVSVLSEDEKYLNLTMATAPTVSHSSKVRPLGRSGDKFLVSVSEVSGVGENSVVIDPKSGKLVSLAVRVYNPGVLSHHGKTGSIIGHEKMPIPDFTTFVRQFDGTVNKTFIPFSSIRFARLTALDSWKPLDPKRYQRQKNEIRKITDTNNDFLMFFKANRFDEALRSRRLGRIAERYQKPFLHDRLSRDSYERKYREYMLDITYALKAELQQPVYPEQFYSIYRQELIFQLKLRRAMYDYLAESSSDPNIINVLHTDLQTRYNNCGVNNERIGGSIGGGY